MGRYDYGFDYSRRGPYSSWYPGSFWAAPLTGWAGWAGAGMWDWPPYAPIGYGRYGADFAPRRRRPEESPTYGRAGDPAVRRYARHHGYDAGYAIPPHLERVSRRPRRYDRGYGRGW